MGNNLAAMLMNLAGTIAAGSYQHVMELTSHFNVPLLYVASMCGKTLAATCAAYIMGCDRRQIYSRYGNVLKLQVNNNM